MSAVKQMIEDFRLVGTLLQHHIGLCKLGIQTCEAQEDTRSASNWRLRLFALEDLLLEIEAQDVEFPPIENSVPINKRADNDSSAVEFRATMEDLLRASEETDC